jgi:hypothetical protein
MFWRAALSPSSNQPSVVGPVAGQNWDAGIVETLSGCMLWVLAAPADYDLRNDLTRAPHSTDGYVVGEALDKTRPRPSREPQSLSMLDRFTGVSANDPAHDVRVDRQRVSAEPRSLRL